MFDPITNVGLGLSGLFLFVAGLLWFKLPQGRDGAKNLAVRHIQLPASALGMSLVLLGLTLLWHTLIRWAV